VVIHDNIEQQRLAEEVIVEEEEDNSQPLIQLDEAQDIPLSNDDNDDLPSPNDDDICEKLSDRIQHIEEQEKSGGLGREQAAELKQRIEAMQNNLEC
jgi:hypothetical protein